jgi:hypothetical protein
MAHKTYIHYVTLQCVVLHCIVLHSMRKGDVIREFPPSLLPSINWHSLYY